METKAILENPFQAQGVPEGRYRLSIQGVREPKAEGGLKNSDEIAKPEQD